jgi:hypothetical protein
MEEASTMAASPWITCFCVVKFDLEYGHSYSPPLLIDGGAIYIYLFIYLSSTALEECQPEVSLPPEERKNMYVFKN